LKNLQPLIKMLTESKIEMVGLNGIRRQGAKFMMPTEYEILTKAYEAFNARDIDEVLSLMHPDVDWANGMNGGRMSGREAVREYWTQQWKTINPRVEPESFETETDGRINVKVKSVVRDLDGNVIHDGAVEHLYSFENNSVKRMEIRETPEK